MAIDTKTESESKPEYKVIGTRPIRHDGVEKVTGRAQYGADVRPTGLLRGRVLRSPHAHARIKSIDTSKAEALSGVKAVVTAKDFPDLASKMEDLGEIPANVRDLSSNLMARDKVLYKGHALAAVAAVDDATAAEALKLIQVEYEVLKPVLHPRDAMKEDAPLLDESRRTKSLAGDAEVPSNIAGHVRFEAGNVEQGFKKAEVVVEREYWTPLVHQGYIEPHTSTALWNGQNVTIWTSTQGHFSVRQQTADLLRIPLGRIKVIPQEIGGGFGGKLGTYLDPLTTVLARKAGRPVQLSMSRTEVFEASGPASSSSTKLKIGAMKDGTIVAVKGDLAYAAGAFPGSPVGAGCMCMVAPYDLENVELDGYDVVVNTPKTAAYRAPGAPQSAFAMESLLDELALKLGMDPIALRLKNAAKEGTKQVNGQTFRRIGFVECLEAAKNTDHYKTPLGAAPAGKARGRGIAAGYWFNGGMKSSAMASVNQDGSVSLAEGSVDIGGTRTSIAMQLAETLGITVEKVRPHIPDTDSIGFTAMTGGSRTTYATGLAAYEAAMEVRKELIARAAVFLEIPEDDLVYENGAVHSRSLPDKRMSFDELAARANREGAAIVGQATVNPRGAGPGFAVHIVDLEVDKQTGKTDVLRYTAIQDAGTAIYPPYVEGQMQGGMAQGIGWALNEEYIYDANGRMLNASYLDYRMPTALDLPMLETLIVEVPNPLHPYGVRGVGETGIVPPLAAVANAAQDALKVRFTELPISPRNILEHTVLNGHNGQH